MEPASDTGNSNSDNLTNKQNPKFEGTAGPIPERLPLLTISQVGRFKTNIAITVADGGV